MSEEPQQLGVVVIGRNEGERLKACLRSVADVAVRVYVDSGSTDGSPDWARAQGVAVVELPTPPGFTAARARNAGLRVLLDRAPGVGFVQMVDGDCELAPGWIEVARSFLDSAPDAAAVFGRLRERHPEASLYNRLCQAEWDGPIGEVPSSGGIAMFRVAALQAAGGYTETLIAGEEPDLCLRMRAQGWKIVRLDADMARHDAAMFRFGQWWRRTKRSGHAFAELARRHGRAGEPKWRRQVKSILAWAGILPLLILLCLVLALSGALPAAWIAGVALLLLYPFQIWRMARRAGGLSGSDRLAAAALAVLGKFAQLLGAARYWRNSLMRRQSRLIE